MHRLPQAVLPQSYSNRCLGERNSGIVPRLVVPSERELPHLPLRCAVIEFTSAFSELLGYSAPSIWNNVTETETAA
jgi:hypothetical protein